ncbi:HAD-IIB family hydrolase [Candidatus Kaiserbacteria bacterium]|nr:HAD-IIB family hydrolase [Candidatus Kaiserbacteria bacterium]
MPRHFFFDLDNTLTRSKSHITSAHAEILMRLTERADVVVVSGHPQKDIREHLEKALDGRYYILAQNGNYAQMPDGKIVWERRLSPQQVAAIHEFTTKARKHLAYKVRDENDIIEDRGCQVAFSFIGHHENQDIKDAFDPDHAKRKKLLEDLREDIELLRKKHNIQILIAGTTNLDIIEAGKTKGYNITEFIKTLGWRKEDCIYIGDALFPGGNDETVIGIIPTRPVKDYKETYEYLQSILK